MSIEAAPGESVPLQMQLGATDTGKFPRAIIRTTAGAAAAGSPVTLVHVATGFYFALYIVPSAAKFMVQIIPFDDVGQTIIDLTNRPVDDLITANAPIGAGGAAGVGLPVFKRVRIKTGSKEPIGTLILNSSGAGLTGLTDIVLRIRRTSDGLFFDWSDDTFKTSPTTLTQALTEVDATNAPGRYKLDTATHDEGFDTSAIQNTTVDETYELTVFQTPGTNAANVPQIGEIKEGDFVDDIDPADGLAGKGFL